jgi:hypothetical protein
MTLSPTGRIVKEETFFGALLKFAAIATLGMLLAIGILAL